MADTTGPRIRTDFPFAVEVRDNVEIPLTDGTILRACLWLPVAAAQEPVPAILEYVPYRKGDSYAADDAVRYPWFAGHGYACVRVDIRGSGDSSGVLLDEYHPQEQLDCLEILKWIAAQPWCTGDIGMMGISWSGFNSLQVAAHRPPELKAIITCCSTDDRYTDDVHYVGGLPLAFYLLPWASVMMAFNARPPDPTLVGENWREIWMERLEGSPFLAEEWLRHQRRDDYWEQGSVRQDYSAITAAVYIVGGWSDGYTSAIPRLLEGLTCPRKALVGPWEHVWPEFGYPGPAIGFLQEALRFWDHWLKGVDNGVMAEPELRYWRQDSVEPRGGYDIRPGAWAAEATWPSPHVSEERFYLRHDCLGTEPDNGTVRDHSSPLTLGLDGGSWLPYCNPADLPADQRAEDAWSLTFDGAPLEQELEILGCPAVALHVAADRPRAFVAVRLCDVHPDGTSTLITRGLLNLCHREGHRDPVEIVPGRLERVNVDLKAISYVMPPGNRLRVAVSTSYWPWAWPSPEIATITVACDESSVLVVPVRSSMAPNIELPAFDEPETAAPLEFEWLAEREPRWEISHDVVTNTHTMVMARALAGAKRLPNGIEYRDLDPVSFSLVDGDPLSPVVEAARTIQIGRGDWQTRVEVRARMTCDAENFFVTGHLEVFEGSELIFERSHDVSVPRDYC